ncbi:hypothetical protein UF75_4757 [Desulfosporosinus sp. I2]|nr:hypothetical protein UF75_4757 [Desulfosporosinus sp. I2]
MEKLQCPCCGYYSIKSEDEVIVDICEICLWQYDLVAHKNPDISIGPNKISLNEARYNYKTIGVSKIKYKDKNLNRDPFPEELIEANESKD